MPFQLNKLYSVDDRITVIDESKGCGKKRSWHILVGNNRIRLYGLRKPTKAAELPVFLPKVESGAYRIGGYNLLNIYPKNGNVTDLEPWTWGGGGHTVDPHLSINLPDKLFLESVYTSPTNAPKSPCALEHHAMKVYSGTGAIAPRILHFSTRWR
jgi:hypothetical protein